MGPVKGIQAIVPNLTWLHPDSKIQNLCEESEQPSVSGTYPVYGQAKVDTEYEGLHRIRQIWRAEVPTSRHAVVSAQAPALILYCEAGAKASECLFGNHRNAYFEANHC